eukprot:2065921-Rhodomonas_salina.1
MGQIHDKKRVRLTAVRAEVMTYIYNNWRWLLERRRPLGAKPGKPAGAFLSYALGAVWDKVPFYDGFVHQQDPMDQPADVMYDSGDSDDDDDVA